MLKSLAQLRRDISLGDTMILTYARPIGTVKHRFLSIPRYVVAKMSNAISLSLIKGEKKGASWLDLNKSSLIDYKGNQISIYEPLEIKEASGHIKWDDRQRGALLLVYTLY